MVTRATNLDTIAKCAIVGAVTASESASRIGRSETDVAPEYTVNVEWRARVAVLAVSGDVDMVTAPRFQETLSRTLEQGPTTLVVDLSGVDFFASAGLSALVGAYQQAGGDTNLRVVATNSATLRPLEVTALDHKIPVYGSLDEAVNEG